MGYNVICDRSGFKRKRKDCRKQWDGLLVLDKFWERRQPQDKLPAAIDNLTVSDPRPEPKDVFVDRVTVEDLCP
jgi:hypothetical protein